ncbi:MAG: hypothetical protein WC640_00115 [Candidatus Paceibacterota bacterium]|jgi:hypothetical protein
MTEDAPKPTPKKETILGPAEKIERASHHTDFTELFKVLDEIGPIEGSLGTYPPEVLKDAIRKLFTGESTITQIPGTYKLRSAIARLSQSRAEKIIASIKFSDRALSGEQNW